MIVWEVADKGHNPLIIPNIHLSQMTFMNVTFKLHGTARFVSCRFEAKVEMKFAKNHYESDTAFILKTNYVNYAKLHQITLLKCFIMNLAAEFISNIRYLLIKETKIKDAHFKHVINFDPREGQIFSTSSYLTIKVDRSETDNSFHVMGLPDPNDISRLIIRSSTFMKECELQTQKVQEIGIHESTFKTTNLYFNKGKEIEIYDSTFERCTVSINNTLKIEIDHCKLKTTNLYFNKDEKLIERDHRQYPKDWLCHLFIKNTVSTEPLLTTKNMATIDIENCTFQNSQGIITLTGNQNDKIECYNEIAFSLSVMYSRFY